MVKIERTSILAEAPIAIPGSGRSGSWSFSRASLQHISLILLVLQNSALILILHHARTRPIGSGQRYMASTAVLAVEVIKLGLSLVLMAVETARSNPAPTARGVGLHVWRALFSTGSIRLVVPAMLYTLQNTLVYIAISNLDAVTFQVTYQLKILTTVLFSIALLGRVVTQRQWLSLILLTLGVAIVQVSGPFSSGSLSITDLKQMLLSVLRPLSGPASEAAQSVEITSNWNGCIAVLAAAMISGFTCVYFEKLVKDQLTTVSIWTRNAQLAFFSIFPALLLGVYWQDGAQVAAHGFFAGYTPLVWATVLLQAVGGMIVAVCIAYADNVAKNFAASLSIVVSCTISALFQAPTSLLSTLGTIIVILAVYLYQVSSRPRHEILPTAQIRSGGK